MAFLLGAEVVVGLEIINELARDGAVHCEQLLLDDGRLLLDEAERRVDRGLSTQGLERQTHRVDGQLRVAGSSPRVLTFSRCIGME